MVKLLLDVDPGCDDAVMIAMALAAPGVELVGLTTVAGNSTVDNTTRNALAILELLDRTDVPVARGAGRPIVGDLRTAEWVHGPGGIRGDLPEPATEPVDEHAVEFILDRAREHGDELTIAAVGPLTNLAAALVQDPALPDRVGEIYLMGGAAMTVGNATPMAEANFANDPVAARRVVSTASPRMAGLDATNDATVPMDLVEEYRGSAPPLDAIGAWLDYPPEVRAFGDTADPAIHDAAVLAHILDGVLSFEPYYLDVDTTEGPSRGAVICDKYGVLEREPNGEVAVAVDTAGFRTSVRRTVESL